MNKLPQPRCYQCGKTVPSSRNYFVNKQDICFGCFKDPEIITVDREEAIKELRAKGKLLGPNRIIRILMDELTDVQLKDKLYSLGCDSKVYKDVDVPYRKKTASICWTEDHIRDRSKLLSILLNDYQVDRAIELLNERIKNRDIGIGWTDIDEIIKIVVDETEDELQEHN